MRCHQILSTLRSQASREEEESDNMMASNHPEHEAPEKRVKDDAMQVDTVKDDKGDAMQEDKAEPDIDAGDENGDAARARGFPNARPPFGVWTRRTGRLVQDPGPAPTEPVEQQPRYQPGDEEAP
ncbi:hypothetical protein HDU96_003860 [Phlyctochytrium bullatum]|nr:hypothetical protein HDU96_003860 [Phlyctochytrium bullatum]